MKTNKTIIYSPLIDRLFSEGIDIHYASHITGHGWRKFMRASGNFSYILENIPKPQPIFKKIQQATNMSSKQMYGDYNMGAGFALFVPEKSLDKIFSIGKKMNFNMLHAGYVEQGPRRVVIKSIGVVFEGQSLQIR